MSSFEDDCCPIGTVAIIGGGASGVLAASHLLSRARQPIDVVVVAPDERLGAGIAYSTTEPIHLLNTRSGEMSAWSDRPGDFTAFATAREYPDDGNGFLPRSLYREYLVANLKTAQRQLAYGSGFECLAEEAIALSCSHTTRRNGHVVVGLGRGAHLVADHVILAIGPPRSAPPWEGLENVKDDPSLIADPWSPAVLDGIDPSDKVLLIGTGLTMADIATSLYDRGHRGRLVARSKHGLLPLRQQRKPTVPLTTDLPILHSASELLHAIRVAVAKAGVAGQDWRGVVASVRDQAPALWQALPVTERQRLLRHARRYWEIHRHRMAPEVADVLDQLISSRRLEIGSGRLVGLERHAGGHAAHFRRGEFEEVVCTNVIVNCTGPAHDYGASSPLVCHLLRNGLAITDPTGFGLLVDEYGDLCDRSGRPNNRIHTLGWLRSGNCYESSAVPEIRLQAETLTARLTGQGR